ncbi:hypothetical protein COK01_08160 [Priestia megaterium]|uniref:hypothetical protein n=1 Tax=Priestia megaterium TaxID=1404 RepID=UPI000BF9E9E6|nr:hypothetical protein [Priestia megaterium]PFP51106.1 hypothetical protein COK01_08160 [Priestia megaterium]PGX18651.1 hypothetical protein COE08_19265 [Priestia megaterium]
MVGGQGEDSCVKSGTDETRQERPPSESSALYGNQQRCNKGSMLAYYPICSSLDWGDFVMSQSLLLFEFRKIEKRRYFFCVL